MKNKMIIGSFYFSLTDHQNLLGEYSNVETESINVEAAKRFPENPENPRLTPSFIGKYRSIWTEDERPESSFLDISELSKDGNKLKLIWYDRDQDNPRFTGEGMIVDGTLIGHYQNQ